MDNNLLGPISETYWDLGLKGIWVLFLLTVRKLFFTLTKLAPYFLLFILYNCNKNLHHLHFSQQPCCISFNNLHIHPPAATVED